MLTAVEVVVRLGVILLVLCALLVACAVCGLLLLVKCDGLSRDADTLARSADEIARTQLTANGRVGDIDSLMRAQPPDPQWPGDRSSNRYLEEYRVVTRHSNAGYEIVVEPRHWCFCKPTIVIPTTKKKARP